MELLSGFGFGGFRSFYGDDPVVFKQLTKVNLIAGQNNSGKSNVLRVAQRLSEFREKPPVGLDVPQGLTVPPPPFTLLIRSDATTIVNRFLKSQNVEHPQLINRIRQIFASSGFDNFGDDGVWIQWWAGIAQRTQPVMTTDPQIDKLGDA